MNLTVGEAVKLLEENKIIGNLSFKGIDLTHSEKVIYHQLLTLATMVSGGELKLRMTQSDISKTIGIALSNLKRKLTTFSSLGLIEATKEPEHRFDTTKTYRFKKVEMEEEIN